MKKNYVILPVYNDWDSLKKVLEILNQSFKTLKSNNFIIIEFYSYSLKVPHHNWKNWSEWICNQIRDDGLIRIRELPMS